MTLSSPLWKLRRRGSIKYDPDAAAYFAAVQAADGQQLPFAYKTAINTFILGQKAVNSGNPGVSNWDAIKQANILCGAATLSGALVPLKGVAVTNNNFVAGDYSRSVGLKGDGTTKYLNTNRNNNADPQNNRHMSVWRTISETRDATRFAIAAANGGAQFNQLATTSTLRYGLLANSVTGVNQGCISDSTAIAGYHGASRNASGSLAMRYNGINNAFTDTSSAPVSSNVLVFCRAAAFFSNAAISFYSIGESVDQAALDAGLATLMDAAALLDTEAAAYNAAVETAEGQTLSTAWKNAVARFVVRCKTTRIDPTSQVTNWDSMKAANIMVGVPTLTGALVPLKGAAPTNVNFVAADYNSVIGLKGDGATKYLNSNRNNNADPQDSRHLAVWRTLSEPRGPGVTNYYSLASGNFGVGTSALVTTITDVYFRASYGVDFSIADANTPIGYFGVSRTGAAAVNGRWGGVTTNSATASSAPVSAGLQVFADGTGARNSNAAMSFYSIGEAVDQAALDGHLATLMTDAGVITDIDAINYVYNVQAAGSSISSAIAQAVNTLATSLKSFGLWAKTTDLALLCGVSSLAGLVVKLKGTPNITNNNFTSGDYTPLGVGAGLKGDGVTKYLNPGILAPTFGDTSASVYITTAQTAVSQSWLGTINVRYGIGYTDGGTTEVYADSTETGTRIAKNITAPRTGFFSGSSGASNDRRLYRNGSLIASSVLSATTPPNTGLGVFCGGTAGLLPSDAGLASYHVGTNMDATDNANLSTCMNAFMTSIGNNVY